MKRYRNYYMQLSFKLKDIKYVLGSVQYKDIIYILQYKHIIYSYFIYLYFISFFVLKFLNYVNH